jgi:hypothetical protein
VGVDRELLLGRIGVIGMGLSDVYALPLQKLRDLCVVAIDGHDAHVTVNRPRPFEPHLPTQEPVGAHNRPCNLRIRDVNSELGREDRRVRDDFIVSEIKTTQRPSPSALVPIAVGAMLDDAAHERHVGGRLCALFGSQFGRNMG